MAIMKRDTVIPPPEPEVLDRDYFSLRSDPVMRRRLSQALTGAAPPVQVWSSRWRGTVTLFEPSTAYFVLRAEWPPLIELLRMFGMEDAALLLIVKGQLESFLQTCYRWPGQGRVIGATLRGDFEVQNLAQMEQRLADYALELAVEEEKERRALRRAIQWIEQLCLKG